MRFGPILKLVSVRLIEFAAKFLQTQEFPRVVNRLSLRLCRTVSVLRSPQSDSTVTTPELTGRQNPRREAQKANMLVSNPIDAPHTHSDHKDGNKAMGQPCNQRVACV